MLLPTVRAPRASPSFPPVFPSSGPPAVVLSCSSLFSSPETRPRSLLSSVFGPSISGAGVPVSTRLSPLIALSPADAMPCASTGGGGSDRRGLRSWALLSPLARRPSLPSAASETPASRSFAGAARGEAERQFSPVQRLPCETAFTGKSPPSTGALSSGRPSRAPLLTSPAACSLVEPRVSL